MTQPLGDHEFVATLDRYKLLTARSLEQVQAVVGCRTDITLPLGKIKVDLIDDQILLTFDTLGDGRFDAIPGLHDMGWKLTRKGASHLLSDVLGIPLRHLDLQAGRNYDSEDEADARAPRLDLLATYLQVNFQHPSLADHTLLWRCLKGGPFAGLYHSGVVRAVRSTAYQRLDTHDIFQQLMPQLQSGELGIVKAQFSTYGERLNLWLIDPNKAYPDPRTQAAAQRDDRLRGDDGGVNRPDGGGDALRVPACRLTLSETGDGSVTLTPGSLLSVCTNGLVNCDMQKRRAHRTGQRHEIGVPWTNETVEKQRVAALGEIADFVTYAFTDEVILEQRQRLERAAGVEVTPDRAEQLVRGKLERNDEIAKDTVEQIANLFAAMFEVNRGHTLADASECLTQIRKFDEDEVTAAAIEETAGALLVATV